jgi:outer membrane immunogenic protein
MRKFLLAAVMLGAVSVAHAADLPDFLRGSYSPPVPRVNWQGYYVGAQGGYGASDENFNGSNSTILSALLDHNVIQEMDVANWNLGLGKASARAPGYGAFTGYNWQWDDVVVGLEGSYLHGSFGGQSAASKTLVSGSVLSDNNFHDVSVVSSSAISISDMATFRARAGYAYGSFLPYLFGGVALGNANITRTVTIEDNFAPTFAGATASCKSQTPPVCATLSAADAVHNHLIFGYTAGLGVDVNLMAGLFLRAEWEYIRFTAAVDTNVNTVRVGLGYKF